MQNVPEPFQDLLADSSGSFMILTTLLKDGSPLVAPLWFVTEGDACLITTASDSIKAINLRARPKVAFVLMTQGSYARYIHARAMAQELPDVDFTSLYNRIVQKYEGRLPALYPPQVAFQLTPFKLSTFDYRDYQT